MGVHSRILGPPTVYGDAVPNTGVTQYMGMHSQIKGYPSIWECTPMYGCSSIWECIPIYWSTQTLRLTPISGYTLISRYTPISGTFGISVLPQCGRTPTMWDYSQCRSTPTMLEYSHNVVGAPTLGIYSHSVGVLRQYGSTPTRCEYSIWECSSKWECIPTYGVGYPSIWECIPFDWGTQYMGMHDQLRRRRMHRPSSARHPSSRKTFSIPIYWGNPCPWGVLPMDMGDPMSMGSTPHWESTAFF
jgi:hypothetical protein